MAARVSILMNKKPLFAKRPNDEEEWVYEAEQE